MSDVTLLEVINRLSEKCDEVIDGRFDRLNEVLKATAERKINQIILVGSGSSYNEALCARGYVEKMSGLQTFTVLPNELLHNSSVINRDCLYVFVSQSGTSTLTNEAAEKVRNAGALTFAQCKQRDCPLVGKCDGYIDQGIGTEEYGFVTWGYDCGVITLMLMGLEIGKQNGNVTAEEYDRQIAAAHRIAASHRQVSEKANEWFDRNKEALMATTTFTFYGGGPLYGLAIEGALKVMEVAKRNVAVGFEIDDGMHGPTMGYTPSNCVIALNDGGVNNAKCVSLVTWAKEVMHNGYIFGCNPIDDTDLAFEYVSDDWRALEFAPAVQVLAYRLAVDKGVNLRDRTRHKEGQYLRTHG
ncbi:MAG: SIS domain-containing protein [Erysipelotrichaceae bacterium]|nr:SIS domain-containing protein [Erysipelotrichaceae bacterium]